MKSWLAPLPCKMPKTDIRSKLRCNMAQQLGHGHRSFKGSLVRCISITFPCWLGEMNTACRTCFPSYAVSSASRQQPCFYHCQMLAMGFLGRRNHASPKSLFHSYVQSCHCLVCSDFALNLNGTSWARDDFLTDYFVPYICSSEPVDSITRSVLPLVTIAKSSLKRLG